MDAYVMGVVFCPLENAERDSNRCFSCKHFCGLGSDGKEASVERIVISCGFAEPGAIVFESSMSKARVTFVDYDPAPSPPLPDEVWEKKRLT